MSHYKSNLRDAEFNLFEVLGTDAHLGTGPAADLDLETAKAMLVEVDHLARTKLAESFADADRNPPTYDPDSRSVAVPESFKKAFKAYQDSDWWRVELPAELGGQPTPPSLRWALMEFILGANPAIYMYSAGPKFAEVMLTGGGHGGTRFDKQTAHHMVERKWGATMVLTEPDAGSDVGAGRTRALPQPDGTWHIEGVKRFITSGEQDMTENIIHLVLARPVGIEGVGGPGTKGLSLFAVPKFQFDLETGELGERNGVYATGVEHKMGIKVSTTCELTFGAETPAVGWLLGGVHDGIAQMFKVIEHARMMVGTKAIATLSTGYLNALAYAKERTQGADLANPGKDAPRVRITAHPDVRRSLMTQKAFTEGMRLLVAYTASFQDRVWAAEAVGDRDADAEGVNDLLLPIVKGYGSERSWVLLGTESLQTFGGSGFLTDYPVEQYVRDAKIDTLYEGTTAIQGQDLFFRKIVKDGGHAIGLLTAELQEFLAADGPLADERAALRTAMDEVGGVVGYLITEISGAAEDPKRSYVVGLNTTRLLMMLGDLVVAYLLTRAGEVAAGKLAAAGLSKEDEAFYTGKVAAAKFFVAEVLPKLAAERAIAERTSLAIMELDEAAF